MKVISKSLNDTERIGLSIALSICENNGGLICLYGQVGAGKTAITKFIGKYLGIEEKITSPSFVILNEYHSGKIPMYHFDLYRLEKEGVSTILDELDEYGEDNNVLTLVEWAEFSNEQLSKDRLDITINYIDDNIREFCFEAHGEKHKKLYNKLTERLKSVFASI